MLDGFSCDDGFPGLSFACLTRVVCYTVLIVGSAEGVYCWEFKMRGQFGFENYSSFRMKISDLFSPSCTETHRSVALVSEQSGKVTCSYPCGHSTTWQFRPSQEEININGVRGVRLGKWSPDLLRYQMYILESIMQESRQRGVGGMKAICRLRFICGLCRLTQSRCVSSNLMVVTAWPNVEKNLKIASILNQLASTNGTSVVHDLDALVAESAELPNIKSS